MAPESSAPLSMKFKLTVAKAMVGFFLLGLSAWALNPILKLEFLDILDPFVKYLAVGALILCAAFFWIREYNRVPPPPKKASILSSTIKTLMITIFLYGALILGKNILPAGFDYVYAIATYDKYIGVVGKPAVISTKKYGTITIFPIEREGVAEDITLLPRDVILPGVAVQLRSGDIATRLTATQGSEVCIFDIGRRRGKGPIYFLDFTQFPNPFMVTTDLSKCEDAKV